MWSLTEDTVRAKIIMDNYPFIVNKLYLYNKYDLAIYFPLYMNCFRKCLLLSVFKINCFPYLGIIMVIQNKSLILVNKASIESKLLML